MTAVDDSMWREHHRISDAYIAMDLTARTLARSITDRLSRSAIGKPRGNIRRAFDAPFRVGYSPSLTLFENHAAITMAPWFSNKIHPQA